MSICNTTQEQLALGEPLDDDQRAHLGNCQACADTKATASSLSSALRLTPAVPVGFASRLRAQAHARLAQRRQQRAGLAIFGALAAAAALLIVVRAGPSKEQSSPTASQMQAERPINAQPDTSDTTPTADDLRFAAELASLADVESSLLWSADWEEFERPIAGVSLIAWELKE